MKFKRAYTIKDCIDYSFVHYYTPEPIEKELGLCELVMRKSDAGKDRAEVGMLIGYCNGDDGREYCIDWDYDPAADELRECCDLEDGDEKPEDLLWLKIWNAPDLRPNKICYGAQVHMFKFDWSRPNASGVKVICQDGYQTDIKDIADDDLPATMRELMAGNLELKGLNNEA